MESQEIGRRAIVPRALATAALAAVVALGMTACTAPDAAQPSSTAAQPQATGSATDPATTEAAPTDPAAPEPAPSGSMVPPPGAAAEATDGPLEAAPLPSTAARLDEQVAFDTGMVVEVVSVEPIEVEAETPGEISGPAVVVTVAARNDSDAPRSVDSAVVMVATADGVPGVGTTAGDPSPFVGVIAPGATASARYVFMLDPAAGREVTVTVNYAAGEPVAVFTGSPS
ncbi:hypothetical protein [Agrococcus citreus]|uniref:DUF4352 domain-containing protein n=1 Tax=Agrococcus citreus TaxID=84643 RepID=A0ABN1YLJ8_9MICO